MGLPFGLPEQEPTPRRRKRKACLLIRAGRCATLGLSGWLPRLDRRLGLLHSREALCWLTVSLQRLITICLLNHCSTGLLGCQCRAQGLGGSHYTLFSRRVQPRAGPPRAGPGRGSGPCPAGAVHSPVVTRALENGDQLATSIDKFSQVCYNTGSEAVQGRPAAPSRWSRRWPIQRSRQTSSGPGKGRPGRWARRGGVQQAGGCARKGRSFGGPGSAPGKGPGLAGRSTGKGSAGRASRAGGLGEGPPGEKGSAAGCRGRTGRAEERPPGVFNPAARPAGPAGPGPRTGSRARDGPGRGISPWRLRPAGISGRCCRWARG
jgi:hypothetical protein